MWRVVAMVWCASDGSASCSGLSRPDLAETAQLHVERDAGVSLPVLLGPELGNHGLDQGLHPAVLRRWRIRWLLLFPAATRRGIAVAYAQAHRERHQVRHLKRPRPRSSPRTVPQSSADQAGAYHWPSG